MKKLTGFISIIFTFIFVFVLASCNQTSGVEFDKSVTVSTTSITFNLTFAENSNLNEKKAIPHIKLYEYSETETDNVGKYLNQDEKCSFSSGVYTSSKVTFTSLTQDTKYTFRFYVTYNAQEELLATWIEATASENAKEIKSVEDFVAMSDDKDGDYTLMEDLDFNGETVSEAFTSSNPFTGTFDGNGHTIKNFKLLNATTNAHYGLFSFTDGATIKNLNVIGNDDEYLANNQEITNCDYSSGHSSGSFGILIGSAKDTVVEDITIDKVNVSVKGQSSADIKVGGVVGSAVNSSFTNVHATNVKVECPYIRLKACVGLFAGSLSGDGKKTENGTYTAKNTSAEGTLTGTLYYPSSEGYACIGGYAGDLGSTGLVTDSYAVADITIYRDATSTNSNKFDLALGGFVGENKNGQLYIEKCAAVADLKVKAGTESTLDETAQTNKLSTRTVYIAGFVGRLNKSVNKVKDSCYVKKADGITVLALAEETDSDNNVKTLYVKDSVCANTYDAAKLQNVVCANEDTFDTTVLDSKLQEVVAQYLA